MKVNHCCTKAWRYNCICWAVSKISEKSSSITECYQSRCKGYLHNYYKIISRYYNIHVLLSLISTMIMHYYTHLILAAHNKLLNLLQVCALHNLVLIIVLCAQAITPFIPETKTIYSTKINHKIIKYQYNYNSCSPSYNIIVSDS